MELLALDDTILRYYYGEPVRGRHRRTLAALFEDPARSDITWRGVEALLVSLGGALEEGAGSRVRVRLNRVRAVLHRPHPGKELSRPMVRSVREFLINAGIR